MTIKKLDPCGTNGDPFEGATWQGWFQKVKQWSDLVTDAINGLLGGQSAPQFTVAELPAGTEGQTAYATNGRKVGEGGGSGTGVPVYWSTGSWRVYSTDAAVAA